MGFVVQCSVAEHDNKFFKTLPRRKGTKVMGYKLGKGSQKKLEGIDERMAAVVRYAIGVSKQDFSVICGLRTIEEQKALVAKGASQTMKSKHIDGLAVDLMAFDSKASPKGRWELNLYDESLTQWLKQLELLMCLFVGEPHGQYLISLSGMAIWKAR